MTDPLTCPAAGGPAWLARADMDAGPVPAELIERDLDSWRVWDNEVTPGSLSEGFRERISGNGQIDPCCSHHGIRARFHGGHTHQIALRLPQAVTLTGALAQLRLSGWRNIRYLAIGYTHEGSFRHVRIVNPAQDQWMTALIDHGSIGYGLQNQWHHPGPCVSQDIRLYLRGEPVENGAIIDLARLAVWADLNAQDCADTTCTPVARLPDQVPPPIAVMDTLKGYLLSTHRNVERLALAFLSEGKLPVSGGGLLDWSMHDARPAALGTVGTYAFSWHALTAVSILMLHAEASRNEAAAFAAHGLVSAWLENSFFTPDADRKYTWYDHGVAERQLAFLQIWAKGVTEGFDRRFLDRLGEAMVRQAQLLESELFYASHQPTRYHNHAWFQDLALLATGLALPDYPCSRRWIDCALRRLSDQMNTLIVRDKGYAVFVENSIGYQHGVQRLSALAGDLLRLTGRDSAIADMAHELLRFGGFLRYPDQRMPSQGDTFRRANHSDVAERKPPPYPEPQIVLLPRAGYGVVKGNHEQTPFMFCLFATSLSSTHKHEDDLSFTLYFDGIEWLIDPSFHSHEYSRPLPAYLRSAAAHNAIHLPGLSYSIEPGHSQLQGEIGDDSFHFRGRHTAYTDHVITRSVRGSHRSLTLSFVDEVLAPTPAVTEARWTLQCGEGVSVAKDAQGLRLRHPASRFELHIRPPGLDISITSEEAAGERVRGISGLGFMQTSAIQSIECILPTAGSFDWSIAAQGLN